MIKKTLFAASAGLLLLTLMFGRDVVSYIGTSIGWIHETVRLQVPVEFELDRARKMIADLAPEVRSNMHLIAKEEIEVEHLTERIAKLEARQAKGEISLKRIQQELDTGSQNIRFGSTAYTATQAQELASARFQRYKTDDSTLHHLRRVLSARKRGLEAARKKLDGMIAAKQQLWAEVASLEARQKMNEVAQTTSDFSFNDSHLARTRELIRDIETRIQVDERLVDAELNSTDDILFDEESSDSSDVAHEIANYFNAIPAAESLAEVTVDSQF